MKLADEVAREVERACGLWYAMNTPHEGIAVIREEYLELEREVFKKQTEYDMAKMRKEAIHVAAMAMRFILDLIDEEPALYECGCRLDTGPICALHVSPRVGLAGREEGGAG